jgi:hypothetical protein
MSKMSRIEMLQIPRKVTSKSTLAYRLGWVSILFLSTLSMMGGCSINDADKVKHDQVGLSAYVTLPKSTSEVGWEIATLPESKGFDIPGPTDFVSLIAILHIDKQDQEQLTKKSLPLKAYGGIPDNFVRSWLPEQQKKVLALIANGEVPPGLFDAHALINDAHPAKQAVGVITDDVLLIYIEYVSPK